MNKTQVIMVRHCKDCKRDTPHEVLSPSSSMGGVQLCLPCFFVITDTIATEGGECTT